MSKLAIDIEKAMREGVKEGRRGTMYPLVDLKGNLTGQRWVRACYCLSRGLINEAERCPAHEVIANHPMRTAHFR